MKKIGIFHKRKIKNRTEKTLNLSNLLKLIKY